MYKISAFLFSLFLPVLSLGDSSFLGGFSGIMPFVLILPIMYFLLLRPQMKEAKKHKEMISSLKKNDQIITNGGIMGTVISNNLDNTHIVLEIAKDVKIKIKRENVAHVISQHQSKIAENTNTSPFASKAKKRVAVK